MLRVDCASASFHGVRLVYLMVIGSSYDLLTTAQPIDGRTGKGWLFWEQGKCSRAMRFRWCPLLLRSSFIPGGDGQHHEGTGWPGELDFQTRATWFRRLAMGCRSCSPISAPLRGGAIGPCIRRKAPIGAGADLADEVRPKVQAGWIHDAIWYLPCIQGEWLVRQGLPVSFYGIRTEWWKKKLKWYALGRLSFDNPPFIIGSEQTAGKVNYRVQVNISSPAFWGSLHIIGASCTDLGVHA